jgi:hypothetical protein
MMMCSLAGATAPCPTGGRGPGCTCVYAFGGSNSTGYLSMAEALDVGVRDALGGERD